MRLVKTLLLLLRTPLLLLKNKSHKNSTRMRKRPEKLLVNSDLNLFLELTVLP